MAAYITVGPFPVTIDGRDADCPESRTVEKFCDYALRYEITQPGTEDPNPDETLALALVDLLRKGGVKARFIRADDVPGGFPGPDY